MTKKHLTEEEKAEIRKNLMAQAAEIYEKKKGEQMSWEEELKERLHNDDFLFSSTDEAGDPAPLVEIPFSELKLIVREILLSSETIERSAESVFEAMGLDDWGVANDEEKEDSLNIAAAALAAALV